MAGNHCELRCQVATKNQDSVKAAFAAPIRHLQSFTCFHMLLQCWSQGTLDLVLQNTTYHQHGGVQDFSNFHRSKNLLHSTVLPALGTQLEPTLWNSSKTGMIANVGLMVEIRSASAGRIRRTIWGAANLLFLEGI